MTADPILLALFLGGGAALVAGLGALPYAFGGQPPRVAVGAAWALPGGVMVGAGYLLGVEGLERAVLPSAFGALVGVGFIYWTSSFTADDPGEPSPGDPAAGYRQILQDSLHSASEGVAIGVALAVNLVFGSFLAVAFAAHNLGEAMALTGFLRRRGMTTGECAGLAVATKLAQPLLAVATLAVLGSVPALVPGALGFAAGALLGLVLAEMVPEAYRYAGRHVVALLLAGAAAAVLLVEDLLR